jgi:hypothetical protein
MILQYQAKQDGRKTKQKQTQYVLGWVGNHYAQASTNNINKT